MHKTTTLMAALAVLVACSAPSSEAHGEPSADSKAKQFRIESKCEPARSGDTKACTVTIVPAKGYKWNKDFPAELTLTTRPQHAAFKADSVDRDGFEAGDTKASAKLPFEAKSAGSERVEAKANFSVCNDETCLIFRGEAVEMEVVVK